MRHRLLFRIETEKNDEINDVESYPGFTHVFQHGLQGFIVEPKATNDLSHILY